MPPEPDGSGLVPHQLCPAPDYDGLCAYCLSRKAVDEVAVRSYLTPVCDDCDPRKYRR